MEKLSKEKLNKILEAHRHWILEDCEDWENMRADLRNANLRNADLSNAYLRNANLRNADLSNADLSNADLRNAYLSNANLSNAYLRNAYLSNADLRNADLSNADLSNAYLRNADLRNANLSNANLRNADLSNAINIPYIPMVCSEEGEFVGWKKAGKNIIVKLLIPSDAKRSSATTRKCRCNKAKVLELYNPDGTIATEREVFSNYDNTFVYKVGETVEVKDFNNDRWNECAEGIHFFLNRQEAINYN